MTLEKVKVQYTAKTHTTGGRAGASRSDDGRLDVKLSIPGTSTTGTNPEQLFAASWSACFEGAMGLAARKMKITLIGVSLLDRHFTNRLPTIKRGSLAV
jgi:osmotically inducible protein OsmC